MGQVSFELPAAGTYTVTAELNGQTVEQTVEVTENGQTTVLPIVFFAAWIVVTSPVGTALTVSKGSTTYTRVSTGLDRFQVESPGTWTVSGVRDGLETNVATVNVETERIDYPVTLTIWAATLTISGPEGMKVTAVNGSMTKTGVIGTGPLVLTVQMPGTWTVTGTFEGASAFETVDVTGEGNYPVTLSVFEASLTISGPEGMAVTAVHGSHSKTGTIGASALTLTVQTAGIWTVTGTIENASAVQEVDVNDAADYPVSLAVPSILVTVDEGAAVTATSGDTTLTKTSIGTALFYLPSLGDYTITAVREESEYSPVVIEVSQAQEYSVTLKAKPKELTYGGTATALSIARDTIAAVSTESYALFAGGRKISNPVYANVDAYNSSLTHTTPPNLSMARKGIGAACAGAYALFAGGMSISASNVGTFRNQVDAYDSELVHSMPSSLSKATEPGAASVGSYALFPAGGYVSVDVYDTLLTRSTAGDLSAADYTIGSPFGSYAVFAGTITTNVNIYDESLIHTTAAPLGVLRSKFAAAVVGNYILFAGGVTYRNNRPYQYLNTIDVYDEKLTRTSLVTLSIGRESLAGISMKGYSLFGGGTANSSSNTSAVVDAFDTNLTRITPVVLSMSRTSLGGVAVGKYGIFAGGYSKLANTAVAEDITDIYIAG